MFQRAWIVFVTGAVLVWALCGPTAADACSVEVVNTAVVLKRLKGNIKLNGKTPQSCTVELQRLTKKGTQRLKAAVCTDNGDFDIEDLPAGRFRLTIRAQRPVAFRNERILILSVLVMHIKNSGGVPTTYLSADLHDGTSTDCDIGHWSFESYLEPPPEADR